jgi:hypothetical protein
VPPTTQRYHAVTLPEQSEGAAAVAGGGGGGGAAAAVVLVGERGPLRLYYLADAASIVDHCIWGQCVCVTRVLIVARIKMDTHTQTHTPHQVCCLALTLHPLSCSQFTFLCAVPPPPLLPSFHEQMLAAETHKASGALPSLSGFALSPLPVGTGLVLSGGKPFPGTKVCVR